MHSSTLAFGSQIGEVSPKSEEMQKGGNSMSNAVVLIYLFLFLLHVPLVFAQEKSDQAVSNSALANADTRLLQAAEEGDIATLKKLISKKANIYAKDENGNSALLLALINEHSECARFLITHKASVTASNNEGQTPLHVTSDPKIARVLIQRGADVNARNKEYLMTPIFYANTKVLAVLLANGADVNIKGKSNMTPLMWHTYSDQLENVKLLIAHGALVNEINDEDSTALDVAERFELSETMACLKSAGGKTREELQK
jgi:uncharacterized protein